MDATPDVDLKMSTMEKQLDEKALKLRMLREELQIMAISDTLSCNQQNAGEDPKHHKANDLSDDSEMRLSQTQRVSKREETTRLS